ncbi:MAG: SAM-dependent methyltransferase [Bacteroidia bacterium]|nr:SAM-dependent methyltransferase [Bacteroidia bacterium]MBT8309337.1 SAM-dependent methyltransferase [Bacteroidia bacterium]NND12307.1 SAM-dependent methyltransferase [Flavobacteriaceae bacterium]NNK28140.1 SAM-dependent methyltransferase [Flavobacteriaceae bacterium]NNL61302.1 SAM-dependent methyltransferase [Flavobacteriaceae bacterium]
MEQSQGKLYLIPTTLGDNAPLEVLPISVKKIIELVDSYIVENEKTARRFIKKVSSSKSQSTLNINLINKYTLTDDMPGFLNPCLEGKSVGLMSEAGCPGIADPGSEVVRIAHEMKIRVVPLVGPSSIILAMMSSGMNGQNFTFNGYLPIDSSERKKALRQLEKNSFERNQAQLFIETPYRNNKLLEDMKSVLHPNSRLCIACDITLPTEFIRTMTMNQWKKNNLDLHKRPTLFVLQKD